jgi:hypothetical protein
MEARSPELSGLARHRADLSRRPGSVVCGLLMFRAGAEIDGGIHAVTWAVRL